jgi:hypothetical protein
VKDNYQLVAKQVKPILGLLQQQYKEPINAKERNYFDKHKVMSIACLDNNAEEKMQICIYYLKNL